MGCDIHLYKEKFVDGKWVSADEWQSYDYGDEDKGIEVPWEKRFTDRNYNLFGLLSKGVRRDYDFSFESRGLPFNPCSEIAEKSEIWDGDGHSHSYLYLHELKEMQNFLLTATLPVSGMKDTLELTALKQSIESGSPNWDLLYPYCQSTNQKNYIDFQIDVPATFIVGEGLDKIIDSFDDIDGENHRIVFFFDN